MNLQLPNRGFAVKRPIRRLPPAPGAMHNLLQLQQSFYHLHQ